MRYTDRQGRDTHTHTHTVRYTDRQGRDTHTHSEIYRQTGGWKERRIQKERSTEMVYLTHLGTTHSLNPVL